MTWARKFKRRPVLCYNDAKYPGYIQQKTRSNTPLNFWSCAQLNALGKTFQILPCLQMYKKNLN